MERAERLWPDGPRYRYDEQCFPPSTDSFLLGGFASLRRGEKAVSYTHLQPAPGRKSLRSGRRGGPAGASAAGKGTLIAGDRHRTGRSRLRRAGAERCGKPPAPYRPLHRPAAAGDAARRSLSAGGVQSALFRAPYGSGGGGRPGRRPRGADRHAGGYLCRRRTNAAMGRTLLPCVPAGASGGAADRRRDPRSGAQAASDGAAHRPERPVAGAAGMPPGRKAGAFRGAAAALRLEDGGESHDVRRAYFRDKE